MKYLALLRGINVGGNNIIKMADLRSCLERNRFHNVQTYIQSGNVIFASEQSRTSTLTTLEKVLSKEFAYEASVVLRTFEEVEKTIASMPTSWRSPDDLRCNIAFVKEPTTAQEVLNECEPREGIDKVCIGPGVVYMSTKLKGITKSGINKLIGKKIYREITIRNLRTTQKIFEMMKRTS